MIQGRKTRPIYKALHRLLGEDAWIWETTWYKHDQTFNVSICPEVEPLVDGKPNPDWFPMTKTIFYALRDRGWIEKTSEHVYGESYDTRTDPPTLLGTHLSRRWEISLKGIRATELV